MPDIEKWKDLDACSPFIEGDKYYIVVDSEYTTPGDNPETRYSEAALDGVSKLLDFYGKDLSELDGVFRVSNFEDKYVTPSEQNLVPMKVLISVSKEDFDLVNDDPSTCSIDIPEDRIVAEYPIERCIKGSYLVLSGMKELLPTLADYDVFITNINIQNEMLNWVNATKALINYIELNNIQRMNVTNPDCTIPNEEEKIITLGLDTDYKLRYLLVDNEQYTIGYNCLLEQDEFSHITTMHYFTRIEEMIVDLKNKESDEFDFIEFLKKYTLPTPIIEAKDNPNDGLSDYDENGNYAPQPSQPQGPSCKTDEELSRETQTINDPVVKADRAASAKLESDYIGAEETSPAAIKLTIEEITGISDNNSPNTEPENNDLLSKQQILDNDEQGKSLYQKIDYTLNDVLAKISVSLLTQQTIPVMLNDLVFNYGNEVYEDPELQPAFELQDEQKGVTNTQEKFGSFAVKAEGPVLQQMDLPPFFPNTKDYLKPAMDELKVNLGNELLQGAIASIIETFQDFTDFTLSNPNQVKQIIGENTEYKTWLSETAGISLENINNPNTFASLLTLRGGKGFSGIISNILSKKSSPSRLELSGFKLSDVPVPDGLPITIKESDKLQQKYLKQSDLIQITSEVSTGVDELSAVLKPDEFQSLLKGKPSKNVLSLSTKVLTRNASHDGLVFKNKQDVLDVMSGIGKIISPSFLTKSNSIASVADTPDNLGDGTGMALVRAQLLKRQDPTLTDSEIDQIISEEKDRKKQRVLKALDRLQKYDEGKLLPEFPDIFGSNGLISEMPPIVKEVSEKTAQALIDPVMEIFYSDVAPTIGSSSYVSYSNESLGRIGYLYNVPTRVFSNFSLEAKNDEYLFGYTPALISTTTTPTKTLDGATIGYNFGRNFNVDNKGLDDIDAAIVFTQMTEAFGITNSWENWYYNNIAANIEEADTGIAGKEVITTDFTDPFNENTLYEVEVDRSEKSDKVATIRRYKLDPAQQIDARPAGFTDDIVTLSLKQDLSYQQVEYKSDVYKIGTTLATLGDKNATGELGARSFSSGFDIDNIEDLDFNNLKKSNLNGVGLFGSKINAVSVNSSIITQFADYINGQKYSSATLDSNTNTIASNFNNLNLSLDNDIFDVEGLKADAVNTMNFLLNGSLTGQYCDSLSEIRRNTLNISLRLLVRAFIIEQALISIQVFNGFDLAFMDNQIFANSVYSLLKKEISKYQQSFDTLESSLLIDIKEAALKYYEIMNLSGQSEEAPSSGKDAVRQMILDEAKILKEPITLALNLKWNATTWNGFLTKVIFGEYDDINDLVSQTDNIMQYGGSTYVFVKERKPAWVGEKGDDGFYIYSYNLVYVEKQSILSQIDNWTSDYIITDEDGDPTGWEGTTILSVECTREDAADDEDEVYDSLAKLMFETDEYNKVFNDISPIKVFIASLSLYQHSALSDPATFSYFGGSSGEIPYIGADLSDFMAKTKLTILQLFASSIYGGGKIDYQDPFLQKAQP